MVQNMFKREKTLSEQEDEIEKLELEDKKAGYEFSIAQKRAMSKQLEERGLRPEHITEKTDSENVKWKKIWEWLKKH